MLKEAEAGVPVAELCRKHGMSSASFYKWRAKYGGMDISSMKRLKELEQENAAGSAAGNADESLILIRRLRTGNPRTGRRLPGADGKNEEDTGNRLAEENPVRDCADDQIGS